MKNRKNRIFTPLYRLKANEIKIKNVISERLAMKTNILIESWVELVRDTNNNIETYNGHAQYCFWCILKLHGES